MKTTLAILLFLFSFQIHGQEIKPIKLNPGFENISSSTNFPEGWLKWGFGDYSLSIDTAVKSEGNYSMRIEVPENREPNSFGGVGYGISLRFNGKKVTLKGKMKTENVSDGFAGLLLRIDGKESTLHLDNMQKRNIKGTIDWTEYSIELPLDERARVIYIGAVIQGTGKIWVDDLSLFIDNKDIRTVELIEPSYAKGELDHEFDGASGISINNLSQNRTDNLFILGRVWGFLKYYHPAVAKGDYNWDYELFRITPKILNAASKDERNSVLLQWINSLGDIKKFKENESVSFINAKLTPDLDWLKDKNTFGEELTAKYELVRTSKRADSSYYINQYQGVGNPKFTNENTYTEDFKDMVPDDGYRLLALFRYWNMIQYFFPDKHLIGEDWNNVLSESIPLFVNQKSDLDYRLNVLKLIARIHDTHANIWGYEKLLEDYKGNNTAPAGITFIEEKPIITEQFTIAGFIDTASRKPELKIGDEIISINGKSSVDIIKEKLPYTCASNYPTQLREIAMNFLRTNDGSITIKIMRDGKEESKEIKCLPFSSYNLVEYWNKKSKKNERCWKFINKDIGYINPATIKNDSLKFIMNQFKDTKGIIIDMRCYPGEFMVFTLGAYLMPNPTDFVKFSWGNLDYPGLFTLGENLKVGGENKDYYKGKIIIIDDESTQSQAEYTTMAFRTAPNAKVIGSTTAGADGNVSEIFFPGGIRTMISGIGVITPDGKETQRVGIIPDIESKPTIKGFREGKDEVLLKAIELIGK